MFKLHEFQNITAIVWEYLKRTLAPNRRFSYQSEYEAEATEPSRVAVLVQVFALDQSGYWSALDWPQYNLKEIYQGSYESGNTNGGGSGLAGDQQRHPGNEGGGHRPEQMRSQTCFWVNEI